MKSTIEKIALKTILNLNKISEEERVEVVAGLIRSAAIGYNSKERVDVTEEGRKSMLASHKFIALACRQAKRDIAQRN